MREEMKENKKSCSSERKHLSMLVELTAERGLLVVTRRKGVPQTFHALTHYNHKLTDFLWILI